MSKSKETEKINLSKTLSDELKERKKIKFKKSRRKEFKKLNELNNLDKDELLKQISSISIKTNSKILNDVLCDLSSLSSETIKQSNIELSEIDKQRINQYKERQKELLQLRSNGSKKYRKQFTFDISYFKSCSFYKQFLISILSTIIIINNIFILNASSSNNKLKIIILEIIYSSITIFILFMIILFYLCHFVGKFTQNSWLLFEFYIYSVFTIFYFINTIIIFSSGNQFVMQGILGIFIFLNFFILSLTKLMMAHLKITAQQCVADPDGNRERAKQLNSRFTFPKLKLLRAWTV